MDGKVLKIFGRNRYAPSQAAKPKTKSENSWLPKALGNYEFWDFVLFFDRWLGSDRFRPNNFSILSSMFVKMHAMNRLVPLGRWGISAGEIGGLLPSVSQPLLTGTNNQIIEGG